MTFRSGNENLSLSHYRAAGGSFSKKEQAQEDQYFHNLVCVCVCERERGVTECVRERERCD